MERLDLPFQFTFITIIICCRTVYNSLFSFIYMLNPFIRFCWCITICTSQHFNNCFYHNFHLVSSSALVLLAHDCDCTISRLLVLDWTIQTLVCYAFAPIHTPKQHIHHSTHSTQVLKNENARLCANVIFMCVHHSALH